LRRRLLLVLVLALVVAPTATAAFSIAITTANPINLAAITLNGVDQTKTFTIAATEVYTNAGSPGWNVTASSTTLTSAGKTLPAMVVTAVARGNCTGGGCLNPVNSVAMPVTLSTTAQRIYNAASGSGTGTVVLTGTYQVTYPANALPGTYSAIVTLATATGP